MYRDNHSVLGVDLNMIIRETTEDVRVDRLLKRFTASGHMKDLEDLIEKYKNKPEQLKPILSTTYQFKCGARGVTLYADPECTQETMMEQEQTKTRKVSFSTEQTRKRATVDKQDEPTPEQAEQEEGDTPVGLDEKGKQFVDKFKNDLESKITKFDSDMAIAAELEQYMAQAPVAKMKLWRKEIGLTMNNVDLAIQSGKFIGFRAFKAGAADMKKSCNANSVLLRGRIKQATEDKLAAV